MTNKRSYEDNLHVLRDHIASERVDLVYLDPSEEDAGPHLPKFANLSALGSTADPTVA